MDIPSGKSCYIHLLALTPWIPHGFRSSREFRVAGVPARARGEPRFAEEDGAERRKARGGEDKMRFRCGFTGF